MKRLLIFLVTVLSAAIFIARSASAATFTNLYILSTNATFNASFQTTNSDGLVPDSLIISGNVIYGCASGGGLFGHGTIFRVNTDGSNFTNLFNFNGGPGLTNNGDYPNPGLVLVGNTLYGTTHADGRIGLGNIFKINTDGSGFTVIHDFTGNDGQSPEYGLSLHSNLLYGTTPSGGSNSYGNIFTVDLTNNNVAFVYQFTNQANAYGGMAFSGNVAYGFARGPLGSNGWIYTFNGGYSILYNFFGTNGSDPWGTPIISGNTLFGTTPSGGAFGSGNIFRIDLDGNNYTNLYSFSPNNLANTDGALPYDYTGLAISGNKLYGTATSGGGAGNGHQGTVFQLNTDGSGFTVLKFFNFADGAYPDSPHLSGGTLYGATWGGFDGNFFVGPVSGSGAVFSIALLPTLNISPLTNRVVLSWSDPTFSLTTSTNITGTFTNIPSAPSPYTNLLSSPQRFFRLQSN
jgi:uncharacterized repeat protein (TIGR03803 family)